MATSATIPVASMAAANKALQNMGHGIGNFSVPTATSGEEATHAALHLGGRDEGFLADLQSLAATYPGLVIGHDSNTNYNFDAHLSGAGLQWVHPVLDGETEPYMTGDERTADGKTWVSLIDNNVWPPPVGWREVAENPEWVQPVSYIDEYPAGFVVTHNGSLWTSDQDHNVWEPGVFGWTKEQTGGGWVDSGETVVSLVGAGVIQVSDTAPFPGGTAIRILGTEATVSYVHTPGAPGIIVIAPHIAVSGGETIEVMA